MRTTASTRSKLRTGALCAAAFVAAAVVSPQLFSRPPTDFVGAYHPGALGLQEGRGYVDAGGRLVDGHPPGYSLLIAPFVRADPASSLGPLRLVHGILAAALAWLLLRLADRLLPAGFRLPAVLLGLFWPPQLALGYPGGSEMLFAVLVTGASLQLVRVQRASEEAAQGALPAVALGAWLGFATLVRTMGLAIAGATLLSLLLAASGWGLRRRLRTCAIVLLLQAACVAPWMVTYTASTGRFGFTNSETGMVGLRLGFQRFESFAPGRALEERRHGWVESSDVARDLADVARRWPVETTGMLVAKLFRAWYAADSGRFDALVMPMNLPWALLFLGASARALLRWRRMPGEVIALHGMVLASWLSAFVTSSLLRYMAPVFPLAVVAIAWHFTDALRERGALASWSRRLSRSSTSTEAAAIRSTP